MQTGTFRISVLVLLLFVCLSTVRGGGANAAAIWTDRLDRLERSQQQMKDILVAQAAGLAGVANEPAISSGRDATPKEIAVGHSPILGHAVMAMMEFSDFQCPFCTKFARESLPSLKRDYIDTGRIAYVFRQFPLESLHPGSTSTSAAAACAMAQGKFWDLHDILFERRSGRETRSLADTEKEAGVHKTELQSCLESDASRILDEDFLDGVKAGVTGTPTFFFGTLEAGSVLRVSRKLAGAQPLVLFRAVLDSLLQSH